MIYKYFEECKKLIVLITLLGMLIGMLFFITKDTPPTLVLKKKKINIEYGQTYYANFKGLVDTTGMSKEEICYLKKNVSITDNLQNEDQKSYPAVGKYKIFIKYNNKLSTIQIICKDTLAPVLAFPIPDADETGATFFLWLLIILLLMMKSHKNIPLA